MTTYIDKDYCLKNTQILAEGNNYRFWERYHDKDPTTIHCSRNWKSSGGGYIYTVGRIDDRPINVEVSWYEIDGVVVCLYDGVSQLVDWKMIEDYLSDKFPTAKKITNAPMNYHNVFHHIREINKHKNNNISDNDDEPSKKKTKK